MAILFFDGFDRCLVTKELDPNFWSFEPEVPVAYKKYAFGGYTYDHSTESYSYPAIYQSYTPNNGLLPTGIFQNNSYDFIGNSQFFRSGNYYPGFGSPLGFLALNNLDISNNNLLAPITYIQCSGFDLPNSGQSFLCARILGIETKHSNYVTNDKPGRFTYKHPLVAFCSGNITGILLNIIKTTGNHLDVIENEKMTIGLEVEQPDGISGIFDLNIASDLSKYQIRSIYNNHNSDYDIAHQSGLILTVSLSDNETEHQNIQQGPISRWCHFQFGIIQTGNPYLQIKIDDIDLLSIPVDDTIMNKDLWDDKIYISGFNFDNIRFFNRTYHSNILGPTGITNLTNNRYYNLGSVTLIDDIILSDGSGSPFTFLGRNSKVIPFMPGISGNIATSEGHPDGILDWSVQGASSARSALKNADGDTTKVFSSQENSITAIRYSNTNLTLPDQASAWRFNIEDSIGGIKIYSQAKKEFLDTRYTNVIYTGQSDPYDQYTKGIVSIDDNNHIIDKTNNIEFKQLRTVEISNTISKFDQPSLVFNDSFIYGDYGTLLPSRTGTTRPDPSRFMVLESWIYFTGDEPTYLYCKEPPSGYTKPSYLYDKSVELLTTRDKLVYNTYGNSTKAGSLELFYDSILPTGQWHHIAIVKDSIESFVPDNNIYYNQYRLIVYTNGLANTNYRIYHNHYLYTSPLGNPNIFVPTTSNDNPDLFYDYQIPTTGSSSYIDLIADNKTSVFSNILVPSGSFSGSGLIDARASGNVSMFQSSLPSTGIQVLSFDMNYNGHLYFECTGSFSAKMQIFINGQPQLFVVDGASFAVGELTCPWTGVLPVLSGDNMGFNLTYPPGATVSIGFKEFFLSDGITSDTYYLRRTISNNRALETNGLWNSFWDSYNTLGSYYIYSNNTNPQTHPLFIGGNNIISNWRLTQGAEQANSPNQTTTRYSSDFLVPQTGFTSVYDDYASIGPIQTLSKTRYGRVNEFFIMNNPITNQPWSTGLFGNTSGILLGVKKL